MNSFTISQLQQYTGISVHSIRAWEKRYQALKPNRSEGNTRNYSGLELKRLLNIASLMNSGFKISALCAMNNAELNKAIKETLQEDVLATDDSLLISQLISSAFEYNEELFETIFSCALSKYGLEGAYIHVIYPALQRIGSMWTIDSIGPAEEHFFSNLLKQKLNAAINELPLNTTSKNHWLLFLPENEYHDFGLIVSSYLIRKSGQRCTYIGANMPYENLSGAVKKLKPTSILFFLVAKKDEQQDIALINYCLSKFKDQDIFVVSESARITKKKVQKRLHHISTIAELNIALQ